MAVPSALLAWCTALERYGTMPLADVVAPAIRLAERGFDVTSYFTDCLADGAADLRARPGSGRAAAAGRRAARARHAAAAAGLCRHAPPDRGGGAAALYGGPLGAALAATCAPRAG